MENETAPDYLIFLLSTDWFFSSVGDIEFLDFLDSHELECVRSAARSATNDIMRGAANYYEIPSESGRTNKFIAKIGACMRKEQALRVAEHVRNALRFDDAERSLLWGVMLTIRHCEFDIDAFEGVRAATTEIFASFDRTTNTYEQRKSQWDARLDEMFGDLKSVIFDFYAVDLLGVIFFFRLSRILEASLVEQDRLFFWEWLSEAAMSLGIPSMDANQLEIFFQEICVTAKRNN